MEVDEARTDAALRDAADHRTHQQPHVAHAAGHAARAGVPFRDPRAPSAASRPARAPRTRLHAWLPAVVFTCVLAPVAAAAPADSLATAPTWPTARVRAWQTGALRPERWPHASLSFARAAAATAIGGREGAAFAGTLLLGVGKEAWDARSARFDTGDLAADLTGAALGTWAGSAARR